MTKTPARYKDLLASDDDLRRWHSSLALASEATADRYAQTLERFCRASDTTPQELLAMDSKAREDLVQDFVSSLVQKGRARITVQVYLSVIKSWLEEHGQRIERKIRVAKLRQRSSPRHGGIFTPDDVRRILNCAGTRTRASIALTAFSGLRFEAQAFYKGKDGLRLQDIHRLRIEGSDVVVEELPLRIRVPEPLSKNGKTYWTFLGPEGTEYLVAYLRSRLHGGEALTPDSPVITHIKHGSGFLTTDTVSENIRKAMRDAGIQGRPYLLRHYFDHRLMRAEGDGLIIRDYRQFWMGHSGDIEFDYTFRQGLPKDTLEDMDRRYLKACKHLETRRFLDEDDGSNAVVESILQAVGCSDDELAGLDVAAMDAEAVTNLLHERLSTFVQDRHTSQEPGKQQRLVAQADLAQYLEQGWTWKYDAPSPEGTALIEKGASTWPVCAPETPSTAA